MVPRVAKVEAKVEAKVLLREGDLFRLVVAAAVVLLERVVAEASAAALAVARAEVVAGLSRLLSHLLMRERWGAFILLMFYYLLILSLALFFSLCLVDVLERSFHCSLCRVYILEISFHSPLKQPIKPASYIHVHKMLLSS